MAKRARWQTIIHFGCEGGGVTVTGRKRSNGTWELRSSSTNLVLDANDDERWIDNTHPLRSLAEAFESARRHFGAMMAVEPVHPEFRDEVLSIVNEIAPRPGDRFYEAWQRRSRESWDDACAPTAPDDPEARRPRRP